MPITLIRNARVLDLDHPDDDRLHDVVIEGDCIRELGTARRDWPDADVLDARGRTLMPGLIDCHVHVVASVAALGANARLPDTLAVLRAVPILRAMLHRGFTTVRDAGGADHALAQAVAQGVIEGPRLFVAGKALSQTGGHADFRDRDDPAGPDPCSCSRRLGAIGRVVDGVDAVRLAVREELRGGAHHIKVMASGGIASPIGAIDHLQFSADEIGAMVDEAGRQGRYVMAHAYTSEAVRRVVELGVRTVEHGNLVDDETAAAMARAGAFMVPTLVTYDAMRRLGAQQGLSAQALQKNERVRAHGLHALEILRRHDVKTALGTDLLGEMHALQADELLIRAQVLGPLEVLRQATLVGAEVVGLAGTLGVVAPQAKADLLLVDGDPLKDLSVLCGATARIDAIMKDGAWVRRDAPPPR